MSIIWNTKAGRLGTLKELDYYEIALNVIDTDSEPLSFMHLSGVMPPGMHITTDGVIKGVPSITGTITNNSAIYAFTIRAANPTGRVSDRTFSFLITNQSIVRIYPRTATLGAFDDGRKISYQFQAVTDNPAAGLTWSILSGSPPDDVRTGRPITLSPSGLLEGYPARLIDTTYGIPGYDDTPNDTWPLDFSALSRDKIFTFTIQVTDGFSYDVIPVSVTLISKGSYTTDNNITLINNTVVTTDASNDYVPIITTDPTVIPTLQEGNRFSFQFQGFDPQNDTIRWSSTGLPSGLSLSSVTGWMTGTLPLQAEEEKVYTFTVTAYKRDATSKRSVPLTVNMKVLRDAANYITWTNNTQLGTIINGTVSELKINAVSNLQKTLSIEKLDMPNSRLPQGLKLLPTGEIIGRSSFQYYSLDGDSSIVNVNDITGITPGMTVEGIGVAAGAKVLSVSGSNTVKVRPAIYITEGSSITFRNLLNNFEVVTQTTSLSTTTSIDKNKTTFDCTFTFTAKATTDDGTATATKQFTITVNNYNRAPYQDLYLVALPTQDQRKLFKEILSNADIFPPSLIYRPTDPNFGIAKDISMLFLPGMSASSLQTIAEATQLNHYNKQINFGNIKTARATDDNFNTKYEVVYLEVEDNKQYGGVSAALSQEPAIANYYLEGGQSYHTIYPNSFSNMNYRLSTGVGFSHKNALPDWMTSPQENGRVLGLTRAIVLAYTVPGASKLIAYRIANNNINFNNIDFVADRYYVDNYLSTNYDLTTNRFFQNKEATFDVLVSVDSPDLVNSTIATGTDLGYSIAVTTAPKIGYGWVPDKVNVAPGSVIYDNTYVVSVNGTVVTFNNPVVLNAGDTILFRGAASATYGVTVPFDSINGQFRENVPTIDGVKTYSDGETLVFVQQEQYAGYTGANDGWNRYTDLFIGSDTTLDEVGFDNYDIIPGYAAKNLDPSVVNQRAGIWRINIDVDGVITLTLLQEIVLNQAVKIGSGTSYAGTIVVYDPAIPSGLTVPTYVPQLAYHNDSGSRTRFDGSTTRFYDHRDNYAEPQSGGKYIKFPQIGVFR